MKNVYDEVYNFYDQELSWDTIVNRDWIEGFLRQKAWQGASDSELRMLWRRLRMFLLYIAYSDHEDLEDISYQEYSVIIEWISTNVAGTKATLKNVKSFFDVLLQFFAYLQSKNTISGFDDLKQAAEIIAGGKKLQLYHPSKWETDIVESCQKNEVDEIVILGEAVERIIYKLGNYYQNKEFNEDFQRALYLFSGPLAKMPEEHTDNFWLEFWDYFLFDYRLITNDYSPIENFYNFSDVELSHHETKIIEELINSKFTVFYMKSLNDQDWMECVNLFTDEVFVLPRPDFEYGSLKKMLFFGHIFSQDIVLGSYITSMEVSFNLRQRIKDEVARLKALFEIQEPSSTWESFFARHALVVRHTIGILVNLAKVNVTPLHLLSKKYPHIPEENITPNLVVNDLLKVVMQDLGFSVFDVTLAQKMWLDYSKLIKVQVRKPATWVGGIVYCFSKMNSFQPVPAEEIADLLAVSTSSIYNNRNKLLNVLELEHYDPRYVNEEGFILSLFCL